MEANGFLDKIDEIIEDLIHLQNEAQATDTGELVIDDTLRRLVGICEIDMRNLGGML